MNMWFIIALWGKVGKRVDAFVTDKVSEARLGRPVGNLEE
jgi:hypothetical protein